MNQWPSSPIVRPWRIGIGPAPTKLSQPSRSVRPSTGRPAGLGRSSTQTDFAVFGGGFQHIAQRRDEGVDAATEILQVDEQHVEAVHHRRGRPAHFAVQAEDRDAVQRVEKSGDSTMLSCLSPRRPCCGPKAALSVMSGRAARASSEWVRSAVTEAGWASRATRRPASGRRRVGRRAGGRCRTGGNGSWRGSFRAAKTLAEVKVGLGGAVGQRPIALAAVARLDDRGEADVQHRPPGGSSSGAITASRRIRRRCGEG
jgi:hypothetical protein